MSDLTIHMIILGAAMGQSIFLIVSCIIGTIQSYRHVKMMKGLPPMTSYVTNFKWKE